MTVVDDPAADAYPTALDVDGHDGVFVGRIRDDLGDERARALDRGGQPPQGRGDEHRADRRAARARQPAPLRGIAVKVAVVGAGLAGLACAVDLARAGST